MLPLSMNWQRTSRLSSSTIITLSTTRGTRSAKLTSRLTGLIQTLSNWCLERYRRRSRVNISMQKSCVRVSPCLSPIFDQTPTSRVRSSLISLLVKHKPRMSSHLLATTRCASLTPKTESSKSSRLQQMVAKHSLSLKMLEKKTFSPSTVLSRFKKRNRMAVRPSMRERHRTSILPQLMISKARVKATLI